MSIYTRGGVQMAGYRASGVVTGVASTFGVPITGNLGITAPATTYIPQQQQAPRVVPPTVTDDYESKAFLSFHHCK